MDEKVELTAMDEKVELTAMDEKVELTAMDEKEEQPSLRDHEQNRSKGGAESEVRKDWKRQCKKVIITLVTLCSYSLLFCTISLLPPFYPIMADKHNVPNYVIGLVLAISPLCMAVSSPLIGYFLPHLGFKFTLLSGLFLSGGSMFLFGFVSLMPFVSLIVFSFLLEMVEGIGTAMYRTAAYTLLAQLYPNKKGMAAGLIQLSMAVGYTLGTSVGGWLQEAGGFKLPFIVFGGCIAILLLFQLVLVPSIECKSRILPWRLILKFYSNFMFVELCLTAIIIQTVWRSFTMSGGKFFSSFFHLRLGYVGLLYFTAAVFYVLGAISSGVLADKLKIPRYLTVIGHVIGALGCLLATPPNFITTPKLPLTAVGLALFGAGLSVSLIPVYPAMFEIAKTMYEDKEVLASTLSGILNANMCFGLFLGAVLGGVLVQEIGNQLLGFTDFIIFLLNAVVLLTATVIHRFWISKRK